MLEQGINALLQSATSITSIVGTGGIYPVLVPEGSSYPCLSYQVVTGASDFSLDGTFETEKTIQFDAWGKAYADTKSIQNALHQLLDGFSGALADGTLVNGAFRGLELDDFESDARVYRALTEYTFHYQES